MSIQVTSANYDAIATSYNVITELISQGGNRRAQRYFLDHIDPASRVLTIGCGSVGFNLDLARHCDNVVFVDISTRMLEITRRNIARAAHRGAFEFVCTDVMRFQPPGKYDVVLANFFLNTFRWDDCRAVLGHIVHLVKPDGVLCIADEARGSKWTTRLEQAIFRPLVTGAHRIWVGHPPHPIYDYTPVLAHLGFRIRARSRDRCDYIESTVYAQT